MSDTTTPIVTGTDFITVPTKDIAASEAFYGGLLGLTFAKRWGKMPGAEYETGNLTLALMEPEAFGGEFAKSSTAVALRVDDVAARRELEAKGDVRGDDRLGRLLPGVLRRPRRQPADPASPVRAGGVSSADGVGS